MTSKRFIQLLLTVTAITVIVIGLSVGVSKRIASSSLGTAATLATQATLEDDDCVQDDDSTAADGIVHRRRLDKVVMIVPSSSHRSVRAVESEWPWEEELRELAFSMEDNSMSVSSKAGKSSKGSIGKSGKSSIRCNSKSSKGKSGKSYQTIDLCQKQAKTFKGQSLTDNYEWAMADGSSSKGILSPTICSTNAPMVVPTTSGTNSPQQGTYSPTVTVSTYSPTISVSPPVSTFDVGSVVPTSQPTQKATTLAPTESPVSRPPSPMPLAAIVPPVNVEPQSTNFPTFGATPTVSTEVTGPPTKPGRDTEPI
eukprot:scaffold48111_cov59-Cyclotella_meneghiniana.AAC.2